MAMTIYGVRRRVVCYVTRGANGDRDLLVLERADDDPSDPLGVQVPAGEMIAFETLDAAAVREVEQETGLTRLGFERQLGAVERGLRDAGGPSITMYVHLTAADDNSTSWQHLGSGDGAANGMRFSCRWEPLPLNVELAPDQDAYLDQI
jgi:8-oxo-dGTP pyrophosphatase MutT (NUDIX family)